MTAIAILGYQNGAPIFPENFQPSGWIVKQQIVDSVGTHIKAMLVVQITDEEFTAASTGQITGVDWCYRIPAEDGATTFTVQDAAAMEALDLFEVKLNALTRNGYLDPISGIRIKGGDREMAKRWSPQTVAYLNKSHLGVVTPDTVMTTFDYDDKPVQMTVRQFLELMDRFTDWFNLQFFTAAQ